MGAPVWSIALPAHDSVAKLLKTVTPSGHLNQSITSRGSSTDRGRGNGAAGRALEVAQSVQETDGGALQLG